MSPEVQRGSIVGVSLGQRGDRSVRLWQPQLDAWSSFLRLESVPRRVAWHPNASYLLLAMMARSMRLITEMKLARTLNTKIQPIHNWAVTKAHVIVAGVGGSGIFANPVGRPSQAVLYPKRKQAACASPVLEANNASPLRKCTGLTKQGRRDFEGGS